MPSIARFFAGLAVAPLAGAAAALVLMYAAALFFGNEAERSLDGASKPAMFIAFWSFLVCLAYTLVLGTAAYIYTRLRRTPPLWVAIVVGLLGSIPFFNPMWRRDPGSDPLAFIFPAAVALCAIVTATVFWRLALSRPAPR